MNFDLGAPTPNSTPYATNIPRVLLGRPNLEKYVKSTSNRLMCKQFPMNHPLWTTCHLTFPMSTNPSSHKQTEAWRGQTD